MTLWQAMATAPRDGRDILVRQRADLAEDADVHLVVRFDTINTMPLFPWLSETQAWSEPAFDAWMPIRGAKPRR